MNQINKEEDGRVYSVNLEEIEDFCILRDSEYISFQDRADRTGERLRL